MQGAGAVSNQDWELLRALPAAEVRRRGRFLVADLLVPHIVCSTSARNGGITGHVRHLVNHQSCEGAGHDSRFAAITGRGPEAYHDEVCAEIDRPPGATVTMGTAANMNYAATVEASDEEVSVAAIVTAGVQSNAVCAGDPARFRETGDGIVPAAEVAGTINTMLLVNLPVAPGALARLVVTITEAKSAALQRLAVPSRYSPDLATGTGTDQFALAAPSDGARVLTSASPHLRFGEIAGRAVRDATLEALRWQNGLEPSVTRGLFHALGRYGVVEPTIAADLAPLLDRADLALLERNGNSVFFEPLVGAAAHALAAVLDRIRHGTLPESIARDAAAQQAASLAASLAARVDRWPEFRARLLPAADDGPRALVLAAIALGWSEKWRTR
jgi:adenosylcobinamide amidohydrolase